jgi:hypothetical protein
MWHAEYWRGTRSNGGPDKSAGIGPSARIECDTMGGPIAAMRAPRAVVTSLRFRCYAWLS